MRKTFIDILNVVLPNCVHIAWYTHILNLVGKTLRGTFTEVDKLIALVKLILFKAVGNEPAIFGT